MAPAPWALVSCALPPVNCSTQFHEHFLHILDLLAPLAQLLKLHPALLAQLLHLLLALPAQLLNLRLHVLHHGYQLCHWVRWRSVGAPWRRRPGRLWRPCRRNGALWRSRLPLPCLPSSTSKDSIAPRLRRFGRPVSHGISQAPR